MKDYSERRFKVFHQQFTMFDGSRYELNNNQRMSYSSILLAAFSLIWPFKIDAPFIFQRIGLKINYSSD